MLINLKNLLKSFLVSSWMYVFGSKGELSELLRCTAKVMPETLSRSDCEKLIAIVENTISEDAHPRVWRDHIGSDTRIWCFEREIGELINLFEIERWIEAIDSYTGRKTRSWCLMANRVMPKMGNLGSGGGMHRDSPFSHQVKCIWYLSDVGSKNGPFQYIRGTNVGLVKNRAIYPLGKSRFHDNVMDNNEVVASAGSLLVCDTKCIHGGKPIEVGVRYAVTLYTFPKKNGVEKILGKSGLGKVSS